MELEGIRKDTHVLLLTGIASPNQLILDLQPYTPHIHPLTYGDHHPFSDEDFRHINDEFESLPDPKMIITTEKDATRIYGREGLSAEVKEKMYILPVNIRFMLDQEEMFNQNIIGYVRKNSRNSILVKAKDDNKAKDGNHPGNRSRTISFRNH